MINKLMLTGIILLSLLHGSAFASGLAVNKDLANIRNYPGPGDSGVILQVPRYYPLKVREQRGEFLRVEDYKARLGWIHASTVDQIPTIIVRANIANLRKGPGLDQDILFKAQEGVAFRLLENNGSWLQVRHASGKTGWISKSLVWGHDL
jgi:SH3-like domain-containing protein